MRIPPEKLKKFKAKKDSVLEYLNRALDPRGTRAYDTDKKKRQDEAERLKKAKLKLKLKSK